MVKGKHRTIECTKGCGSSIRSDKLDAHTAVCTGSLVCLFCHSKGFKTLAGLTKHKKICSNSNHEIMAVIPAPELEEASSLDPGDQSAVHYNQVAEFSDIRPTTKLEEKEEEKKEEGLLHLLDGASILDCQPSFFEIVKDTSNDPFKCDTCLQTFKMVTAKYGHNCDQGQQMQNEEVKRDGRLLPLQPSIISSSILEDSAQTPPLGFVQIELSSTRTRFREITTQLFKDQPRIVVKGYSYGMGGKVEYFVSLTSVEWAKFLTFKDLMVEKLQLVSRRDQSRWTIGKINNKQVFVSQMEGHPFVFIEGLTKNKKSMVTLNVNELNVLLTHIDKIQANLASLKNSDSDSLLILNDKRKSILAQFESAETKGNSNGNFSLLISLVDDRIKHNQRTAQELCNTFKRATDDLITVHVVSDGSQDIATPHTHSIEHTLANEFGLSDIETASQLLEDQKSTIKTKAKTIGQIEHKISKYAKGCNEKFGKLEVRLKELTDKIGDLEAEVLLSRDPKTTKSQNQLQEQEQLLNKQDEDIKILSEQKAALEKAIKESNIELKNKNDQAQTKVLKALLGKRKMRSSDNESDCLSIADTTVFSRKNQELKKHQHLAVSRLTRRKNSKVLPLKKQDLSEEKLHAHFMEVTSEKHQLDVPKLNYSFIQEYPIMKTGESICATFIDGLNFDEALGNGRDNKELQNYVKTLFTKHNLSLYKCLKTPNRNLFTQKASTSSYFMKLDDAGYDLTMQRLQNLQSLVGELKKCDEFNSLNKLDATIDCQGAFFCENFKNLKESQLSVILAQHYFKPRKHYIQQPTCVSYERDDAYLTYYCKPIQLFEVEQLYSKIGNGLQTIFGSEKIAYKVIDSQETSFFRIELRQRFDVKGIPNFESRGAKTVLKESEAILKFAKEAIYKSQLIFKVPMTALWKGLWRQVDKYFVILSKNFVTIVFGQNPHSTKYLGKTYPRKSEHQFNDKFVKKFIKVYGLPNKQCYVVKFQDKKRYQIKEWLKTAGTTCLPLNTLFKEGKFDRLHLRNKTLSDFGMMAVGNIQFQSFAQGIVRSAQVQEGNTVYNSLSKNAQDSDFLKLASAIEQRFLKKTSAALPLKKEREFQYFSFSERLKTLFMFHPRDLKNKYAFKFGSEEQFTNVKLNFEAFRAHFIQNQDVVILPSGATVFMSFSTKVIWQGDFFFYKGETNEETDILVSEQDCADAIFSAQVIECVPQGVVVPKIVKSFIQRGSVENYQDVMKDCLSNKQRTSQLFMKAGKERGKARVRCMNCKKKIYVKDKDIHECTQSLFIN